MAGWGFEISVTVVRIEQTTLSMSIQYYVLLGHTGGVTSHILLIDFTGADTHDSCTQRRKR